MTKRRAIVAFVEDRGHLVQQLLALRRSWLAVRALDTDLVVMGPEPVLHKLPDDLVKIPQNPVSDDPVWQDYRFINSLACLNQAGSERLVRYSHLLRSDVDTFLFPGWNNFRPSGFRWGKGGYGGEKVHAKIVKMAREYGLTYRGWHSIGATWYGPTYLVRRTAAFAEMLTKHLITEVFAQDEGKWPEWFRGVSSMYASEIAVNHCVEAGDLTYELDADSTLPDEAAKHVHVHCWHTDDDFSKGRFGRGDYSAEDLKKLDPRSVAGRCLEFSMASLGDLQRFGSGAPWNDVCSLAGLSAGKRQQAPAINLP